MSRRLARILTPWQTLVLTLLYLYIARNVGKLLGLECPEPLANLYSRAYFRATWVTTALDAGFWSAMRIRRKWLRDLASIVFSLYYLIAAEQADEKVRKVRGMLSVDHLRVSWNKGTTPYLALLTSVMRPRLMRYPPRAIRIARPASSDYHEPVHAWLYFDGPLSALKQHTKIVLDIPGGGFVAMDPRNHDDKLFAWAGKTGLPVLSLDYRKAPEFPYPYALNECYDVYSTIITSRGRCLGFEGTVVPKVVICADSAGANLAVSCTLMIIESAALSARYAQTRTPLPIPDGMVLMYPGLDMNIGNWMSDEQMSLIKDRRFRKTNRGVLHRKTMQYNQAAATPHQTDDEDDESPPKTTPLPPLDVNSVAEAAASPAPQYSAAGVAPSTAPTSPVAATAPATSHRAQPLRTRLAMTSMISYFNDRILSPEMMRAMILLYIGPHNRPDFSTDYFLSPILAPDSLLASFPRTCFMTGERDPLVDDTVIFAGRIRKAKAEARQRRYGEPPTATRGDDDVEEDPVTVNLIPGISHGFMQFVGVFPDGWKYIYRCGQWIEQLFALAEERELRAGMSTPMGGAGGGGGLHQSSHHHHRQRSTGMSSGDDDHGLEMSLVTSSTTKAHDLSNRDRAFPRAAAAAGENSNDDETIRRKKARLPKDQLLLRQRHEQRHEQRRRDTVDTKTTTARMMHSNGNGNGIDGANRSFNANGSNRFVNSKGVNSNGTGTRDLTREKSLVRLASEDDLLGRRMLGLVGSLTGVGAGEDDG